MSSFHHELNVQFTVDIAVLTVYLPHAGIVS